MAFDRKHYREIKKFMLERLNHVPFQIAGNIGAVDWAKTFLPLAADCIHNEDYEGAQGIKDAMMEFFNSFPTDDPVKPEWLLRIPDYKERDIHAHISFASDNTGKPIK